MKPNRPCSRQRGAILPRLGLDVPSWKHTRSGSRKSCKRVRQQHGPRASGSRSVADRVRVESDSCPMICHQPMPRLILTPTRRGGPLIGFLIFWGVLNLITVLTTARVKLFFLFPILLGGVVGWGISRFFPHLNRRTLLVWGCVLGSCTPGESNWCPNIRRTSHIGRRRWPATQVCNGSHHKKTPQSLQRPARRGSSISGASADDSS